MPTPTQSLDSEINTARSKLAELQKKARLADVRDSVEDMQTTVAGLSRKVAGLRQRGYVFGKEMESQSADFLRQWQAMHPSIQRQIEQQSNQLQAQILPLETRFRQLSTLSRNPTRARPLLVSVRTDFSTLESKASTAERTVRGMYDKLQSQVSQLTSRMHEIEWTFEQLSEATFTLLATEAAILAVKAVWSPRGEEQKDDPEGVLYLTDQRLIFEQKEEVATKKVLFITTEKEKVQKVHWEAPVALAERVSTSREGMLKNEDHIQIHFAGGAPLQAAHLHIWQSCDKWQGLIQRARTKDFDQERSVPVDQSAVDKIKAAPAQCPACGANLNQTILRGQDSLKCEYCGFLIRL